MIKNCLVIKDSFFSLFFFFFNTMATFMDQPFYFNEYESKQDDFYLIQDVKPLFNNCSVATGNINILSQMRQNLFNSTMISFPIPNNTNTERKDLSQYLNACMFADPLDYRLQRSENLLMRMICCKKLDTSQMSLMRLSKGVFVHQVWESSSPHSSPTLSTIESALYNQAVDFNGNFFFLFFFYLL